MLLKLPMIALFLLVIRCKAETTILSPVELLTRRPWMLSGYGFDENKNGRIDADEESIEPCEKDNLYFFYKNGSGMFMENGLSCATGITELPFAWKLVSNNSALDFQYAVIKILLLSFDSLIIYHDKTIDNNRTLRYILIFTH